MTFKTNDNEFLAVPVPLDAKDPSIVEDCIRYAIPYPPPLRGMKIVNDDMPIDGDYEILGSLLTKEKRLDFEAKEEWVEFDESYGPRIFRNYTTTSMPYFDEQIGKTDSFITLILSELKKEFPLEVNPHGNKEQYLVTACEPGDLSHLLQEWRLAQSQVLPDRVLILRLIASGGTRVSVSAVGDK